MSHLLANDKISQKHIERYNVIESEPSVMFCQMVFHVGTKMQPVCPPNFYVTCLSPLDQIWKVTYKTECLDAPLTGVLTLVAPPRIYITIFLHHLTFK